MSTPHLIHSTSINDRSGIIENQEIVQTSRRSTFGEMLLDSPFELVVTTAEPHMLQFHVREDTRFYTASQVERDGRVYVTPKLDESLARAVRFPSTSEEFGSPATLTGSMADLICNCGKTTKEETNLLVAFAASTWFVDCFRRAPCLHLTGSRPRVHLMMRLLACLCRRSVLLGSVDLLALRTLPQGLDATLLIHDENLSKKVTRILDISRDRGLSIPCGNNWVHANGARVLFSDPRSVNASALRIHLAPIEGELPGLKDDAERKIAADFQAKLLRYRMLHFNRVRKSDFEFFEVSLDMRDDARALLLPLINDCNDLTDSVFAELFFQNQEVVGAKYTDLNCLVIEAALCFCHEPGEEQFFVKEITDEVNGILDDRGEGSISSKAVGQTLRGLGLFAERVTEGYRVVLTNSIRERIHRLAIEYNVVSVSENDADCQQCNPASTVEG